MSALDSKEQWETAVESLAKWRGGRHPDEFPHALGVEPKALVAWSIHDAMDTFETVTMPQVAKGDPLSAAVVASLAMQTQIGVELGLWLATTPEGRAFLDGGS